MNDLFRAGETAPNAKTKPITHADFENSIRKVPRVPICTRQRFPWG